MPRLSHLTVIVLVALHAAVHAQVPAGFDEAWQAAEARYRALLDESGIVGGSLVFMHNGAVAAEAYHGLADLDAERPVDANTIYHWASITKTFTGIAFMQLRDRGLVDLDDPVVKYLPELRQVHNPYGSMEEITLRQVMSHTAGFRSPTWPWGGSEPWHPHEPTGWDQIVAMLPYTEIHFQPGSRYTYSNPAIIFLGRIIEQLTGDDYEVYVDKNILKPLGMYRSYYDHTPYHLLPYRSNNYTVRDGRPEANGLDFDTGITVSNGGLNAPLTDMAKYLAFLVGEPGNAVYEGVLKRSSLESMWQPLAEVDVVDKVHQRIGLVFFLVDYDGRHYVGHTGSQQSFQSFFYVDPTARTAAIAAFNTVGAFSDGGQEEPRTREHLNTIRADLFEHLFPLFDLQHSGDSKP